jgi:hypothetical protein
MISTKMEILKTFGINATSIFIALSISDTKEWASVALIGLTFLYTGWKFRTEYYKNKKEEDKEK